MSQPRRAAEPLEPQRRIGRVVGLLVVALLCLGLIGGVGYWGLVGREERAPKSAGPQGATVTPAPTPTPTPTVDTRAAATKALDACRLRTAAGDRVLAESRVVVDGWNQHLGATADFDAGRISLAQRADVWRRTAAEAPGALQRRGSAIDAFEATSGCGPVAGAPADLGQRIEACTVRLSALKKAGDAAGRPVADWTRHLRDEAAQAAQPGTQGDWERGWAASRYAIDEWVEADRQYSRAPACM